MAKLDHKEILRLTAKRFKEFLTKAKREELEDMLQTMYNEIHGTEDEREG